MIAINFNWSTQLWSIIQQEVSSKKIYKPCFTHLISHRTFSIQYANLFLCFSCFYLSWNNKAYYAKMVTFLPSSILKWLLKFHQFYVSFLNACCYYIYHNKILKKNFVLNELKDNYQSYPIGKTKQNKTKQQQQQKKKKNRIFGLSLFLKSLILSYLLDLSSDVVVWRSK